LVSATTSSFGTFSLNITALDLAGNSNFTSQLFTDVPSSGTTGGGGSSTPPSNITTLKIPVISLIAINGTRSYSDLERAVIYARINDLCFNKANNPSLSIADFSGNCALTSTDLGLVSSSLALNGFSVPYPDLVLFYDEYSKRLLIQTYQTSDDITKYKLFTSVLGITNPMAIDPPSLNAPFFISKIGGSVQVPYTFKVNKNIQSCTVTSNNYEFSCDVVTNSTFTVVLNITNTDFVSHIFKGEVSVTSAAAQKDIEIKPVIVIMNVYNLSAPVLGIPVWIIAILSALILIGLLFLIRYRKLIKEKVFHRGYKNG